MTTPEKITNLVERFDRNLDAYKRGTYNETMVRREFIDPLFKELGWDVDNQQGFAEAYKDVVHEDTIKVGSATKAPDYCFRIGGVRKFFLEAKKPSVNIREEFHPAYQLRRYAWSAKLPLSILTDFEEFAVYDCRIRPAPTDKPGKARILYLTFREYPQRWEEIVAIFSKEAVLKGAFDRYVESTRGKRGTAEVDGEFLKEIESWRELLARNIALRNPRLSVRELNYAVQKTIDRIIFLRICEDRGIESYGQLQALSGGGRIYPRMMEIFYHADEKYNSGLFHFREEKLQHSHPDSLTSVLTIDDKVLNTILSRLYYPDCPYEFSVMPVEILGNVYEQFLGKVIRLTAGHQAKIEEKPEVRKAGGVYYTPKYIVDYIVKHTVGRLVEGKSPRQIEKLRILDPACGSGSFLLGAFQYLLDYHRDYYEREIAEKGFLKRHQQRVYQGRGGQYLLTTAEKKRILLNNIYGVDIDSQAVEVTKLSLLLKVLENENQDTLARQLKLWRERALPDLGSNIKCGNSLIGSDFYEGEQLNLFDEEERRRINAFDWETEFPEIMQVGGFDAVIGNPPYGANFSKIELEYLKNRYTTFVWRGESYLAFVEKAIGLLKICGKFGFIIPDTYLNLGFTQPIRSFLLKESQIEEVILLPSNVFGSVTVDTTLLFVEKAKRIDTFHEAFIKVKVFAKKYKIESVEETPLLEFLIASKYWYSQNMFNIYSSEKEIELIDKIEEGKTPLSEISEIFYGIKVYQVGKGHPSQTRKIVDSKPYTSEEKESNSFLPFFDGKHVGRYKLLWRNNNWLNYGKWVAEPRKPEKFQEEKLLIRKIVGKTLIAMYIPYTSYCNTLLYVLKLYQNVVMSYLFLLGIINSSLIGWYYRKRFQISPDDTFPQILIRDILQFPIPLPDKARHDRMVQLVETMLDLHRRLQRSRLPEEKTQLQRRITATDHRIDQLVYDLYGLTEEEIRIVEEAT